MVSPELPVDSRYYPGHEQDVATACRTDLDYNLTNPYDTASM